VGATPPGRTACTLVAGPVDRDGSPGAARTFAIRLSGCHTSVVGRTDDGIDARMATWMESQPVFFVATAPLDADGHVNVSPKGNQGELAVLDRRRLAYLEQTGSGIETVAHLRDNGRIVVMTCAFSGPPRIVRVHGTGHFLRPGEEGWDAVITALRRTGGHPEGVGVRGAVVVDVERVSDSCGYGVPLMAFDRHRDTLQRWSTRKGREGIAAYQAQENRLSIDGLPGLV